MSEISEKLKILRVMNGFNVRQVAQKVDRSPGTISNWENGKVSPDVDSIEKLCNLYEISPNQLLGWEPCSKIEDFKKKQADTLIKIDALIERKNKLDSEIKELYTYLAHVDAENQKQFLKKINALDKEMQKVDISVFDGIISQKDKS